MDVSPIKLHQIVSLLPPSQLKEVIDFADFLSFKLAKENKKIPERSSRGKRLDWPVIKDVKFIGDPLLRREDLYDEWGR